MKLTVYSPDGQSHKEQNFEGFPTFDDEKKGVLAVRQTVLAIQANRRQGNASTKTVAEVRGSGSKPFRQKGTGRARAGNWRSPIRRGGGVVFGPKPRDFSQKINRKTKLLAMQRALFDSAEEGEILVIEKIEMVEPKTKLMAQVIDKVAPESNRILLVDDTFERHAALAARNLPGISMRDTASLNVLDLVSSDRVILTLRSIDTLLARLSRKVS
ncbi:MAG: 50S ribosomal protein L4 [Opitutales bacterium]|nr:50S ribosomal protein L4 [Opitutales bacterium]